MVRPGDTLTIRRTFSQLEFDRFATLSGDDNPIHVDAAFAARTSFGRPVAHGMFLFSTIYQLLIDRFPGAGTVLLQHELVFPRPTFAGEEVVLRLEVASVEPETGTAALTTAIIRPDGETSLEGRAVVRLPKVDQQE
jgi:acyl dehydratase